MKIGDVVQGIVADFASGGEGVVKIDGFPVFVPFAIVGEEVSVKITFVKKDCAFGDLIDVLSISNDRIKPRCPYFGRCGGCSLQHISYAKQLEIKRANVQNALRKIGGINVDVADTVSVNEWEYRNKLALPFGYKKKTNRVVLGFYEKKSHSVVPMKWCALHGDWCAWLIEDVTEWANENRISVYDERTKKGILRHLVARMLDTLCITLVINAQKADKISLLAEKLKRHFDKISIYVSVNRKDTNVIMGEDATLVWGKEYKQNLGAFDAVVSPNSFLQVNNGVRDRIYDDVCENLKDFDGEIIELYSGVGLLTAQIATRLENASITSCEIVPSAVAGAKELMKGIGCDDRVKCVCDDAARFVNSLGVNGENGKGAFDSQNKTADREDNGNCVPKLPIEIVSSPFYLGDSTDFEVGVRNDNNDENVRKALILDPPRKGCDGQVLQCALSAKFDRILYISCNPQTLARDLKILREEYCINSVVPYDMFPQTSHIETLICLKRKQPK